MFWGISLLLMARSISISGFYCQHITTYTWIIHLPKVSWLCWPRRMTILICWCFIHSCTKSLLHFYVCSLRRQKMLLLFTEILCVHEGNDYIHSDNVTRLPLICKTTWMKALPPLTAEGKFPAFTVRLLFYISLHTHYVYNIPVYLLLHFNIARVENSTTDRRERSYEGGTAWWKMVCINDERRVSGYRKERPTEARQWRRAKIGWRQKFKLPVRQQTSTEVMYRGEALPPGQWRVRRITSRP